MQIRAITAIPTPAATPGAASKHADAIDWASTAIQQAVATISDTSGKYSADQQLAAYNWIVNLAKSGPGPGQSNGLLTAQAQTALEALSPPFVTSISDPAVQRIAAPAGQGSGPPGGATNATGDAQRTYAQGSVVDTRA